MATKGDETYYITDPDPQNPGEYINTPRPLGVVKAEAKHRLREERISRVSGVVSGVGNGRATEDLVALLAHLFIGQFLAAANVTQGFAAAVDALEAEGAGATGLASAFTKVKELAEREKEYATQIGDLESVADVEAWEKQGRAWS
jgi:hypothetical protein